MKVLGFLLTCFFGAVTLAADPSISIDDLVRPSDLYGIEISPDGRYLSQIVNPHIEDRPYKRSLRVIDLQTNKEVSFMNFPTSFSVESAVWVNDTRLLIQGSKKVLKYSEPLYDPDLVTINFDGTKQETVFGPSAGKISMEGIGNRTTNLGTPEYASFYMIRTLPESPDQILGYKIPWAHGLDGSWSTYVIKLNVYNGKQETLEKLPFKRAFVDVDNEGKARFVVTVSEQLENEVFYRGPKSDKFESLLKYYPSEGGWTPIKFLNDNKHVIISSNLENDKSALYTLNSDDMSRTLLASDPDGDIGSTVWSQYNDEFLGYYTSNSSIPQLILTNTTHPEALAINKFRAAFPGKQVQVTSATRNANKVILRVYSDVDPNNYYMLDTLTGKGTKLGSARSWMEKKPLAAMKPVKITARDKLVMPSYLTLPKHGKLEQLPLVLLVHGGPYGVHDAWGYDEDVQVLASHGFAVLQVNYRGSDGSGRSHMYPAYREWGKKMQDDLVDAVHWAINEKIADPERVCIMGHSYGGYAAVWGAIRDFPLYKCAVGSMGVYDLPYIFDERSTKHSSRGTEFYRQVLGDDMDALKLISPTYQAANLKVPLLLSHGEMDSVAPIEHYERLREALNKAKRKYEFIEFEDNDHGLGDEKNRKMFYSRIVEFLNKHIGK